MLVQFDSLGDFARTAKKYPEHVFDAYNRDGDFYRYIEKATHGDDTLAAKAYAMIDKLDVNAPSTRVFQTVHSPYGGSCNLGDWLAQSPTPMRRRIRTVSDTAPLRIVVGVSCSAGIRPDLMETRGIAILALVLKLQSIRPIDLFLLTEDRGAKKDSWHYHLIKIESNPLALGTATFGLCSDGIERLLSFTILRGQYDQNPGWPTDHLEPGYMERKRDRLGLNDNDLIIREAYLADPMIKHPVEWLEEQLKKYSN